MFDLVLNEDGLLGDDAVSDALLLFTSGNYHKNVYLSIGVLTYTSKYPPKTVNVNLLITFSRNKFVTIGFRKYLWDHFTLQDRWSAWNYFVGYNWSQLSVVNTCHQQLHLRCCSAKVLLYFNLLLFKMASSKYYVC